MAGSRNVPTRERFFLGWFGVRGIGSIYYAAIAAAAAVQLPGPATDVIVWTAFVCVLVSIVVHGIDRGAAHPGAAPRAGIRPGEAAAALDEPRRRRQGAAAGAGELTAPAAPLRGRRLRGRR